MKIECYPDGQEVKLYRAITPIIESSGLEKTPCGVCPVCSSFNVFISLTFTVPLISIIKHITSYIVYNKIGHRSLLRKWSNFPRYLYLYEGMVGILIYFNRLNSKQSNIC